MAHNYVEPPKRIMQNFLQNSRCVPCFDYDLFLIFHKSYISSSVSLSSISAPDSTYLSYSSTDHQGRDDPDSRNACYRTREAQTHEAQSVRTALSIRTSIFSTSSPGLSLTDTPSRTDSASTTNTASSGSLCNGVLFLPDSR